MGDYKLPTATAGKLLSPLPASLDEAKKQYSVKETNSKAFATQCTAQYQGVQQSLQTAERSKKQMQDLADQATDANLKATYLSAIATTAAAYEPSINACKKALADAEGRYLEAVQAMADLQITINHMQGGAAPPQPVSAEAKQAALRAENEKAKAEQEAKAKAVADKAAADRAAAVKAAQDKVAAEKAANAIPPQPAHIPVNNSSAKPNSREYYEKNHFNYEGWNTSEKEFIEEKFRPEWNRLENYKKGRLEVLELYFDMPAFLANTFAGKAYHDDRKTALRFLGNQIINLSSLISGLDSAHLGVAVKAIAISAKQGPLPGGKPVCLEWNGPEKLAVVFFDLNNITSIGPRTIPFEELKSHFAGIKVGGNPSPSSAKPAPTPSSLKSSPSPSTTASPSTAASPSISASTSAPASGGPAPPPPTGVKGPPPPPASGGSEKPSALEAAMQKKRDEREFFAGSLTLPDPTQAERLTQAHEHQMILADIRHPYLSEYYTAQQKGLQEFIPGVRVYIDWPSFLKMNERTLSKYTIDAISFRVVAISNKLNKLCKSKEGDAALTEAGRTGKVKAFLLQCMPPSVPVEKNMKGEPTCNLIYDEQYKYIVLQFSRDTPENEMFPDTSTEWFYRTIGVNPMKLTFEKSSSSYDDDDDGGSSYSSSRGGGSQKADKPKMRTCPGCRGKGDTICGCHGKDSCRRCGGSNRKECTSCHGKGEVRNY